MKPGEVIERADNNQANLCVGQRYLIKAVQGQYVIIENDQPGSHYLPSRFKPVD